jgi:NitT/TauT family transport system permease protein
MTWLAWQTLRTEILYVGIIAIAVIGILSTVLIESVQKKVLHWL